MTTAVLIIDMQNAYFEDPVLQAQQDAVTAACNGAIAAVQQRDCPVLLVCTEHERDRSTWTLSMLDDDQGLIFRGSAQARVVPGLREQHLPRLVKTRDSAFFGTDLLLRLRNWSVDRVVLAGAATQNCIAQTAADAFANNLRVVIARDAMASDDADFASAMLDVLSEEYSQPVLPQHQILKLLADDGNATDGRSSHRPADDDVGRG
ncbi:cysteine hydrolase family protein [Paenarthrobacter sp. Z7-10]|uniref:cysteine hydrolase family protein n=1 Tax=Paenarthrobacter sp. Z7-10 TaxID=2787635 RepID=UPI0022A98ABC|nr:isochorismatase family cysteine hydrolase [Paenarthrobacter sp. Z7-10]